MNHGGCSSEWPDRAGHIIHVSDHPLFLPFIRNRTCERLDEASKKGACWSVLRHTGMVQWGACRRVFISQHGENNSQLSSNTVEKNGDEEVMVVDSHLTKDSQKGKHLCALPYQEPDAARSGKLWDSCYRVFMNQQGEHNQHPPSTIVKEEDEEGRDNETMTAEPLVPEGRWKRKRTCPIRFQEMDATGRQKQRQRRQCNNIKKNKIKSSICRWSEDR